MELRMTSHRRVYTHMAIFDNEIGHLPPWTSIIAFTSIVMEPSLVGNVLIIPLISTLALVTTAVMDLAHETNKIVKQHTATAFCGTIHPNGRLY